MITVERALEILSTVPNNTTVTWAGFPPGTGVIATGDTTRDVYVNIYTVDNKGYNAEELAYVLKACDKDAILYDYDMYTELQDFYYQDGIIYLSI